MSNDNGKVFRYHNHENAYLGMIYRQLQTYPDPPADKKELIDFIKSITHNGNDSADSWKGERDMIDLYDLVLRYYYSPSAKGSNGLKFILPALIKDSEFLQNKYGETNIVINDHWEADKEAIGLTDKTGQYLAYISTINDIDNRYFVALENPSVDNEMAYSPAGDFDNINLIELENILTRHFKLAE